MLGDSVAVYLDGGPTPAAVPSSIVDVTGKVPVLLRAGALSAEELRKVVPDLEVSSDTPRPTGVAYSGSSTSPPATCAARRSPSG